MFFYTLKTFNLRSGKRFSVQFVRLLSGLSVLQCTTGAQPDIFHGRGGFVKLERFDKHFIKKSRKNAPQENIFGVFLLDALKTVF